MPSDHVPTLKIVLTGSAGSGKSALLIRYCDDKFDPLTSSATIGVDFKVKYLSIHGKPYKLNLLDTAGQERFRTLSTSYYRNASGVILVFDITVRDSFLAIDSWFDEALESSQPSVVLAVVGSKFDKASTRKVSFKEAKAVAERRGAQYFEASAKTKAGVREVFINVIERIVNAPLFAAHDQTLEPKGLDLSVAGVRSYAGGYASYAGSYAPDCSC